MNDIPDESRAQDQNAVRENGQQGLPADGVEGFGQLDRLAAENADLRDKVLRSMAELENFRRRSERERSDLAKFAISDFARDIISIADNLRRALEAVPKNSSDAEATLKTLIEGIEVTDRELIKVFERHGVTRFDPIGEKFDPHVHEAMIKVDVPNAPADAIVQVIHAGYMIHDRVLRPAAVIVAKGEPKVEQTNTRIYRGQMMGGGAGEAQADEPQISDTQAAQSAAAQAGGGDPHPGEVAPFQPHDEPDIPRGPGGAPKKPGQGQDKRPSSMTKPVTDNSGPARKDEFISTFGKRLEN